VGYSADLPLFTLNLIRFNLDGSMDNTFGGDGQATASSGNYLVGNSVSLQSDGKIVVAGTIAAGPLYNFMAIRYTTDGSPDNTFSGDAIISIPINDLASKVNSICIQTDGKIILSGTAFTAVGAPSNIAMARLNYDGTLDNSFNYDGTFYDDLTVNSDVANNVKIQADGKIVIAGFSSDGSSSDFMVARYSVVIDAGTNSLDNSALISTYPNPTNGQLTISFSQPANDVTLKLIDLSGQVIQIENNFTGTSFVFDLSNQAPGIYFVQLNDNETTQQIKVVKS